ncbi:nuA4 complex subunit EAF3 homolog [Contarinia nasturtii]|uniref:nuA4 complex subunit EAF3 homolog n=1 Tax=Contarinia nasturtii TaxID=265458 RepID=UPI0012D496F7|nr:nuA4 complex subunit EAF3 homolog [Contarinia nasturtii]
MAEAKFKDGERVLCYHGEQLYEAKVLKAKYAHDGPMKYFIHYDGWNKGWDEWVADTEGRILKYSDELSLIHNTKIKKNKKVSKPKGKPKATVISTKPPISLSSTLANTLTIRKRGRPSKSTPPANTRKRKRDSSGDMEPRKIPDSWANITQQSHIKIPIPEELKVWLVEDWYAISRKKKLLEIPAKETVKGIIDSYVRDKKSSSSFCSTREPVFLDVMYGLVSYFNVMLGPQLLNRQERSQYAEIRKKYPDKPLAELYGSFHLLRLFVPLGFLLARAPLDQKDIQCLLEHIQDFFKYLIEHIGKYFSMDQFVNRTPEHTRRSKLI